MDNEITSYGNNVYVVGPEYMNLGVLDFMAHFVDLRLNVLEINNQPIGLINPIGITVRGDVNLTSKLMMVEYSVANREVILTANSTFLSRQRPKNPSVNLLQNASAGSTTIAVSQFLEDQQGVPVSQNQRNQFFRYEIGRSGQLINEVIAELKLKGTALSSHEVQDLT